MCRDEGEIFNPVELQGGHRPGSNARQVKMIGKRCGVRKSLRAVLSFMALAGGVTGWGQGMRPRITGISHLCVYSTDMGKTDHFYGTVLGGRKGADPENPAGARYYISDRQFVEVLPAPSGMGMSRLDHLAYRTDDVAAMRGYLAGHSVKGVTEIRSGEGGERWFSATDPEGNLVQFVQEPAGTAKPVETAISGRAIHVGMLVHDRAAEDAFYKGLLGFRPYWYGAMQPGKVDWISQQVPDGTDWLEYMMVGEGSDSPADKVDARQLGVLNHVSLGVKNMEASVTTLIAADRLSPRHDGPQMGKDGKWQANLYDPDGTRVELMEFQPVMKPCCSEFTATSPLN